jgi:hypothetical protein
MGAFILMSQPSMADDLDDLKATHKSYVKAWNTEDFETGTELWIDGGEKMITLILWEVNWTVVTSEFQGDPEGAAKFRISTLERIKEDIDSGVI